jgi:phytoene dehydrogenase-like protein
VRSAIVIGAGHNGLVCAAELAARGVRVTVVEQAPRPGGGLTSVESTLPGFVHDHCAGFLPVTRASPAMLAQPLERYGVEWIVPERSMTHPFADGTAIALDHDLDSTAASLNATHSGAGDAWRRLIASVRPHAGAFTGSVFRRLPPVVPALRLAAGLGGDLPEFARRSIGSAQAFGEDLFGAERPTAWFAGAAMHSGLEPRAAASGAFGFMLMLLGHVTAWPFPRGGAQRVTDALVAHAGALGATVRTDAPVTRVMVRGGRAAGVVLRDGEEIAADAVVATVTAHPLAAMLPDDALPERTFRRLRRWRYGTGVFKVDFALDGPVPWSAEEPRTSAVVHVAGELSDLSRAAQEGNRGVTPERPSLVVGQHSLFDATRAPAGKHTLYTYAHVPPSGRDVGDDELAGRIEEQLERFAPGFRRIVLARHVRPPERLERENPSMVGGDLAGGSFEIDQQLVFRPTPELSRYRAPLRGLYVGSASVHPGGAIHGVPGYEAAHALLRDRAGIRRWRRTGR